MVRRMYEMKKELYPEFPILMVDDEPDILNAYKKSLRNRGFNNLISCSDSREVISILSREKVSVIVLDLLMPYISGEELLEKIKNNYPHIPVIVVTGSNKIETAVKCMKQEAFDYLVKPVEDSRFYATIKNALDIHVLKKEVDSLRDTMLSGKLKHPEAFSHIITASDYMESIFQYVEAIAESPQPVLITGESGAGKELVAHAIHTLSNREGEFATVNIAGLGDTLFSDTLFGHKKGSYTGAHEERKGLIEKAQDGTLFLDEIGDLEISSQVKLFRLLQEREYYKIGSDIKKTSYARIIAATSTDLYELQDKGYFRKELYYRLTTHHIHIPPLRKRCEDIPILIDHFTKDSCIQLQKKEMKISDNIYSLLVKYSFPGNIRELKNIIFNAVSISGNTGILSESYFIDYIKKHGTYGDKDVEEQVHKKEEKNNIIKILTTTGELPTLKDTEKYLIKAAVKKAGGNQQGAAKLLGISQSTMSRRIRDLSLRID
jgi:DNA-binding NtrC family response regulator